MHLSFTNNYSSTLSFPFSFLFFHFSFFISTIIPRSPICLSPSFFQRYSSQLVQVPSFSTTSTPHRYHLSEGTNTNNGRRQLIKVCYSREKCDAIPTEDHQEGEESEISIFLLQIFETRQKVSQHTQAPLSQNLYEDTELLYRLITSPDLHGRG